MVPLPEVNVEIAGQPVTAYRRFGRGLICRHCRRRRFLLHMGPFGRQRRCMWWPLPRARPPLGPDARNVSLDPFVEDAPLLPDVDEAADAVDGLFVQVQARQVLKDLGHDGAELFAHLPYTIDLN